MIPIVGILTFSISEKLVTHSCAIQKKKKNNSSPRKINHRLKDVLNNEFLPSDLAPKLSHADTVETTTAACATHVQCMFARHYSVGMRNKNKRVKCVSA
jgi:hypothetical protein